MWCFNILDSYKDYKDLEFNEERKYNITDNTIDYLTGKKYSEFKNMGLFETLKKIG